MVRKKGEILTGNLVKILLIVLGTAILLFVIFLLAEGFPSNIDKESCKQSIVYRATAALGAFEFKEAIPLKCKTEKICLSMSGEDCTDLIPTKNSPVRKVKITPCITERRDILPEFDELGVELTTKENKKLRSRKVDGGLYFKRPIQIGGRTFYPTGETGYVRIAEPGVFLVRRAKIVTSEGIEIQIGNVVTHVTFEKGDYNYKRYIQIVGNKGKKDVTISGSRYPGIEYDENNPPKFVLDDSGSLVVKSGTSGEYVSFCQKTKDQVMDVFANSLISCHSVLGEGKLNFFPHDKSFDPTEYLSYIGGSKGPGGTKYGLICARIAFDEQAKRQLGTIQFGEFYKKLENKVVDGKSGLNYLYPGVKNAAEFVEIYQVMKNSRKRDTKNYGVLDNYVDWSIDSRQNNGYSILASMVEVKQFEAFKKAALVGLAGGVLIATGIGSPLGVMLLAGTAGSAVFVYNFDDDYQYYAPAIFPHDINKLKKLGIYSFDIAP